MNRDTDWLLAAVLFLFICLCVFGAFVCIPASIEAQKKCEAKGGVLVEGGYCVKEIK